RTITRPPEAVFHFSAISFRTRCQDDPSGTSVAILTTTCWAPAGTAAASQPIAAHAPAARLIRRKLFHHFISQLPSRSRARRTPAPARLESCAIRATLLPGGWLLPSLHEQLVDAAEQPARAALGEQVRQAQPRDRVGVHGQRLVEQAPELGLVLPRHPD